MILGSSLPSRLALPQHNIFHLPFPSMNPCTPKTPSARDLCPVLTSSQGTDEQDKGSENNPVPGSPFPHCSSWGEFHPWAPVCSCNSWQRKEALGFTPQRHNINARGLSDTQVTLWALQLKQMGPPPICVLNWLWLSKKVQVGTETFPMVEAFMRASLGNLLRFASELPPRDFNGETNRAFPPFGLLF